MDIKIGDVVSVIPTEENIRYFDAHDLPHTFIVTYVNPATGVVGPTPPQGDFVTHSCYTSRVEKVGVHTTDIDSMV